MTVQSVSRHRRPGLGRWVALAAGAVLVAAGGVAVALRGGEGGGGCDEPVTLSVVTSPDQQPVLSQLADDWNREQAAEACARVTVAAQASSTVAATLSSTWDEDRDGVRPDVWVPDSSIWPVVAAARPEAVAVLPEQPGPSLASSPVVLAMQQPMAQALGWPDQPLGWGDLLAGFAAGQSWEQLGHPEWGPLRLGIADPTRSTAGLAGVLTALDPDGDETLSDQELLGGIALSQLMTVQAAETGELLAAYADADADAAPAELAAAFPVLERDLADFAAQEPAVPLVPVYLREGTVLADHPYLVLRAGWVGEDRTQAAAQFLAYATGEAGREAYAAAGFRDAGGSPTGVPLLDPDRGFRAELGVVRSPSPEGLGELLGMWPVLIRPNNLLIALDTSGSMTEVVPGTDQTRLALLQGAAAQGIGLLTDQTVVGLWEFSTALTPTTPYRELVPPGPVGEDLGEADRRQAMAGAILGLQASGGTGLYDTIYDAYLTMQEAWQPDAQNILVVITDGKDEFHDGRSLPELLDELADAVQPDRPLPIIAMAVGPEGDADSLEQITQITGGRTIIARDDVSAIQQVILAFAGRIS